MRYHVAQGQTVVEVNLDHDVVAELSISLDHEIRLHARDFLL